MVRKDLIIKDNTLINASYTLDLIEQRIILMAINKSKQVNLAITPTEYIDISVVDYVKTFSIDKRSAYKNIKDSVSQLFERKFSYVTEKGSVVMSRWVSAVRYNDNEGSLSLIFSPEIIPFISELEKRFTSYFLEDVANMTSVYAIRLYELIIAWRSTHKTPIFEIMEFRNKLGVGTDEYFEMHNFKKRVLDVAINQINKHSNIRIECEQHKKGRKITGFSFNFIELKETERDPNTVDWIDQEQKPKREKLTINEIVCRHPNETIGKSEPEIYKMYGSKYHII